MNTIERAKRALDAACLEVLLSCPREVTVSLFLDGVTVDVIFTKEQLIASCERQLAGLKPPPSIGEQVRQLHALSNARCPHGYLLANLSDGTDSCEQCHPTKPRAFGED